MRRLVFFLEEPSAREMLKGLLPRLLPANVFPCYRVFEGKQDLGKQLARRLRGWLTPDTSFVVLRDQDAGNCQEIKKRLIDLCRQAGRYDCLVRIACHTLESWYLGDLQAVEAGLELNGLSRHQNKQKFRDPDRLANPVQELDRITGDQYQEVSGSRAIGGHLDTVLNRSHSFGVFIRGIKKLINPFVVIPDIRGASFL